MINPVSKNDRHGNPTVNWPGRSVFMNRAEATRVAKLLATHHPEHAFFVMEAVSMALAPVAPATVERLWR